MEMPRFFFHIRDHERRLTDEEGMELNDLKEVMHEIKREISSMLEDAERDGDDIAHQVLEVYDEDGHLLASVPFRNPS